MEQQNPNPPPPGQKPSTEPYSYLPQFQYYPPPHHNPNPNPILQPNDPLYLNAAPPSEPAVAPPGVDPYSAYEPAAQYSYASAPAPAPAATSGSSAAHYAPPPQYHYGVYYPEADLQGWAALEAVRHFGLDPASFYGGAGHVNGVSIPQNGTEQLTYPTPQANGIAFSKKKPLKKPKIIQSAYCGICKVDCNSKDILAQHKLGKKHKKNVEKLRQSLAPAPAPVPTPAPAPAPPPQTIAVAGSSDPAIGPQENPEKAKADANTSGKKRKKKKAGGSAMDVETKKRKVLEGGAAAEAVRTCHICNVVCNSDTVFRYHVAGQKHAAMMRKHLSRSA